jgi:circadian clock protein KaiC
MVTMLWNPPLEVSADAWAWQVLAAVKDHGCQRVFIDALTDVQRIMTSPERTPAYVTALANELRASGTTVMMATELEAYVDTKIAIPVPSASASMDTGILMRHVELNGRISRMISVMKVRQSASDPVIQEMEITDQGIVITQPFQATSGVLTGRAVTGSGERP